MKKLILSISLMALIFASCSSSKSGAGSYKVSKATISNTWTVSDVQLQGFPSGYQVKNVFGVAPYQDFVGSTWKLYGGYSGYMSLKNGYTQNIYWSIINNGLTPIFQFKKIESGDKAKNVSEGYQLEIADATKNSMTLRSPFTLANGNTAYIVYTLNTQ